MSDIYVGIDLAAQARNTGVAVLREVGEDCVLEEVLVGAEDEALVPLIAEARKVGVDVPLGWPRPFVELLGAHAEGVLPDPGSTGGDWRRSLAMRATDLAVHQAIGVTPLSVSTDRIAHPALRWAGIEARLREAGLPISRDGSGTVCEVYPAAALRSWQLPHRGYKGTKNVEARAALVGELTELMPRLDWNGHRPLCTADDNALDAVLSALVAREVTHGRAIPPPEALRELTRSEGWIWLPQPGNVPLGAERTDGP